MDKFTPSKFESKWQEVWFKEDTYQPDLQKAKSPYYNLMMFPYPSAEGLHVGNVYAFTGVDIHGRFMRMKGYDVFEPIGLDGFGIHSENYALKIGKHPKEQAKISEANFYRQLKNIGNGFAWKNSLETYDPEYYKWTQWIFVQMFKHGLAYRKKSSVNFCPSCKTVLSDEQVIKKLKAQSSNVKSDQLDELDESVCERCGTPVEKKEMEQWFFKITEYAERLLQNTYRKDFNWTEKVKIGQRNWIGKKEGISIKYQVLGIKYEIECFTTRPDTNFGATFVVLGPEHPFVDFLLDSPNKSLPRRQAGNLTNLTNLKKIKSYVEKAKSTSEQERIAAGRKKTGVFTGFYAVNQLTNYKMPIYISDFVLGHVGTGAVVGVPGHDLRDFEFAQAFKIPVIRVVVGRDGDKSEINRPEQVQEEEGTMVNSGFLNGKDIKSAITLMMDHLEEKGWGKRVTTYRLRDWCISRQRYWGAPIPMIFCERCAGSGLGWLSLKLPKSLKLLKERDSDMMSGWLPVPKEQLPVLLPDLKDWKPEGTGKGPLAKLKDWVKVKCPQCGGDAERETDVCDTFLDSSWYFLRYPSVGDQKSKIKNQKGGKDTSDGGRKDSSEVEESEKIPWNREITRRWLPVHSYIGGAEHTVLHLLYSRFVTMAFKDWGLLDFDEPYKRFYAHGLIIAEGAKMSKSRGNVIIPDEYIRKYGADTLRTYLMFLGPFDAGGDFRDTGIAGMYRFLSRIWRLVVDYLGNDKAKPKEAILKTELMEKTINGTKTNHYGEEKRNKDELTESEKFVSEDLLRFLHKTIKEVTKDLENLRYNTAIAHIMEYVNEISKIKNQKSKIPKEAIENLLLLLAPFTPHMTEELWKKMKNRDSIHLHPWPTYEEKYLYEDVVTIVIQVNGKLRDAIRVQSAKCKAQSYIEEEAKRSEKVKKYLEDKIIRKTIFVPGKLINFVV